MYSAIIVMPVFEAQNLGDKFQTYTKYFLHFLLFPKQLWVVLYRLDPSWEQDMKKKTFRTSQSIEKRFWFMKNYGKKIIILKNVLRLKLGKVLS